MTAVEIENLVKTSLDAGLKISAVENEDGSSTVKITTSFTVGASATSSDVQSALKKHLTAVQAVLHSLTCTL